MQRLIEAMDNLSSSRFLALYGQGVSDSFLLNNLQEVDISHALNGLLRDSGYSRIIYISPTKPISFLDDQSRQLSESILWSGQNFLDSDQPNHPLQPGPYGNRLILPGISNITPSSYDAIGDTHLLRLLDAAMREDHGPATILIFEQAENFFINNQDVRTLSSILEGWVSLPAANHNRCIFLFSANDYSELSDIASHLPIPELRSLIYRNHQHGARKFETFLLGGPQLDEAQRLVEFIKRNDWSEIDPDFEQILIQQISVEDEKLQTWIARFSNFAYIDRDLAYQAGWFANFRGDLTPPLERLEMLVGLDEVKERIHELAGWAVNRTVIRSSTQAVPLLHMVFTGNPGTGKTTVARLMGELMYDLNILKRGHLVETKAADLIAEHVGGTAVKTNQVIDRAIGGVLFIDEAYSLSAQDRGGYGAEAIETLLTRMEDDRKNFIVVLAGYPDQIQSFLKSNPGLSRRFPVENRFVFSDFSGDQLVEICDTMLDERGFSVDLTAREQVHKIIHGMVDARSVNFGNAGEIRNLVDSLERKCLSRMYLAGEEGQPAICSADISPEFSSYLPKDVPSVETFLSDLDTLIGLEEVKNFIRRRVTRIQFENLRTPKHKSAQVNNFQHLIFLGNPGTGKTTVARLIGKIYASLGLLRKGHTIEVSMPDLVAGYVGQTSGKVIDQVNKALEGVLFIDEAYALVRSNSMFQGSYGHEVMDTLVKAMEDHRGKLLIILAGYPQEMETLLHANPGLKSRFGPPLIFPDFSTDDLSALLDQLLDQDHLQMAAEVKGEFVAQLETRRIADPHAFGNARDVIGAYDRVKDRLAERIIHQLPADPKQSHIADDQWLEIILEDVVDDQYTVIIDANETGSEQNQTRLKSWVVPRKSSG
jgi:AAA+ superfamily predicted ATPase